MTADLTRLIPDPHDSERQFERFHHLDLATADRRTLFAELHILVDAAHRLVFNRVKPRVVYVQDAEIVTDAEWIDQRIHRLREHLRGDSPKDQAA